MSRMGLPRVIAYVGVGILFSNDLLGGMLHFDLAEISDEPTMGALSIIAYIIGGSITMSQLRRIGKVIVSTALGESLGAVILAFIALASFVPSLDHLPALQLALPMAAIAATTAPAGTLAVLHQYRASGPVTDTLLGVVAMDDVFGIVFYSVALTLVTGSDLSSHMGTAVEEIFYALIIGGIAGLILAKLGHQIRQSGLRLPLILGGISLVLGLADAVHFSPLLACMALGFAARHFMKAAADRLFAPIELLEELVFLIFFTLAGAHFQYAVIVEHLDLIGVYVVARLLGKLLGAAGGARVARAPTEVVRWLGFGLAPQAGVAVGLALTLSQEPTFAPAGPLIINVILGATLIFATLGPFTVRFALSRAGEIGPKRLSLRE